MKNNILFNYSLDRYNKKYRNRRNHLLIIGKKEVEDFDKVHKTTDKYLLRGNKWALIGDKYYQIPRPISFTWFRNLNAGAQVATCVLLVGGVSAAIGVPTYLLLKNNISSVITEEDFNKAIDLISTPDNENRKLSFSYAKWYSNTEGGPWKIEDSNTKVEGFKEEITNESGDKEYYNGFGDEHYYELADSSNYTWNATGSNPSAANRRLYVFEHLKYNFNKLKFKNGKYVGIVENVKFDPVSYDKADISYSIEFDDHKNICAATVNYEIEESAGPNKYEINFKFSDYNNTTVKFPDGTPDLEADGKKPYMKINVDKEIELSNENGVDLYASFRGNKLSGINFTSDDENVAKISGGNKIIPINGGDHVKISAEDPSSKYNADDVYITVASFDYLTIIHYPSYLTDQFSCSLKKDCDTPETIYIPNYKLEEGISLPIRQILGTEAFGAASLKTINIPTSVKNIDGDAFKNSGLTTVKVESPSQWYARLVEGGEDVSISTLFNDPSKAAAALKEGKVDGKDVDVFYDNDY